ncbi:MAG: hypothetical protein LBC73_02705, partial [Oscillospiraceae bacterium]|nr:hypothetical protein [Oscillospiraceae bacterium]
MKKTTDFKSNIRRLIKATILVFCAVVFTLGIFAVSREFIAIMIMVVSAAVAIITLFHKQFYAVLCKIRQYRFGRILIYTVIACIILATLYTAVISFLMLDAMSNTSPDV